MSTAASAALILKKIGNPCLTLHKGAGYWYFMYDDTARKIYETRSVYVMFLTQMSVEEWIEEGADFVRWVETFNEAK